MTKKEYFIYALQNELYTYRWWLLSVFGILPNNNDTDEKYDILIRGDKEPKMFIKIPEKGKVEISDFKFNQPLYGKDELVNIEAKVMSCIKENIKTTYGIMVINAIMIQYPYGGLIEYINGVITPSRLNKIAYDAVSKNICTIDEHLKFEMANSMLTTLASCGVPSTSEKSIQVNPKELELKNRLFAENKDRLNDPVVISNIQKQLIELHKEYLKGDSSEGFFIDAKTEMSNLRVYGTYGAEPDFYDPTKVAVVTNSLDEGWNIKDIPMLTNASRGGSYFRGASTALAGAEVKGTARIFQNYIIVNEDCNTKHGLRVFVNPDNIDDYLGRYLIGEKEPIKDGGLKKFLFKYINVRSPTYCETKNTGVCVKCMGDTVSNSGIKLTALMNGITSSFLGVFMSMMHTTALSTQKYNYKNRIS